MRKILLFCSILISSILTRAQIQEEADYFTANGYVPTFHKSQGPSIFTAGDSLPQETFLIRLYIMRDDNGQGQINYEGPLRRGIQLSADRMAQEYDMHFLLAGQTIYVDSTDLLYSDAQFSDWVNQEVDPRYINIFCRIAPFVLTSSCGSATLPGSGNMISLSCSNERTISHEIGHLFGLLHTFGWIGGMTSELVDGSNCDTDGDLVCDTPADPYPLGDFDNCTYTDTSLKDANGDLFAPMMDNTMGYYNCEPAYFTTGQIERMMQVAVQDRFYYSTVDSTHQVPHVSGIPGVVCIGSTDRYHIVGYPVGGTFSGAGLVGDSLDVSGLAVGEHAITYHLPASSPMSPYVRTGFVYPNYNGTIDTDSLWQSFIAEETAPFQAVRMRVKTDSQVVFSWKLLDGTGPNGTVLYSQTDTVPAGSMFQWHRFPMDQAFTQQAGQSYTLVFESADSLEWQTTYETNAKYDWPGSVHTFMNHYPCLASEILSHQSPFEGDSVVVRFQVNEPQYPYFEPDTLFCILDEPVSMQSFSFFNLDSWGQFEFLIDQQPTDSVSPPAIGAGWHDLEVNFWDTYGCQGYLDFSIEVVDTPQVTVQQLFCEEDAGLDLTQLWPQGSFFMNSAPADSISPAKLGAGTHLLEMILPNVIDTLTTTGAEHLLEGGSVPSHQMELGDRVWQTFYAERSGYLSSLATFFFTADSAQIRARIWKGMPGTGQLLHSETSWYTNGGSWEKTILEPAPFSSWIEEDSLYSYDIERVDSLNEGASNQYSCSLVYDLSDLPADLSSNLDSLTWLGQPGVMFFRMNLDSLVDCSKPQYRSITVEAAPVIPAGLLAGPAIVEVGATTAYAWDGNWGDSVVVEVTNGTCLNCGVATDSLGIQWTSPGAGSILVYGFNGIGCASDSLLLSVMVEEVSTGIASLAHGLRLEVFPNPFLDQLVIRLTGNQTSDVQLALYDAFGRLVWQQADVRLRGGEEVQLALPAELARGVYSLKVVSDQAARSLLLRKE